MSDLIKREEVIKVLEETQTARSEDNELFIAKINAIMRVSLIPSAQPEQLTDKEQRIFLAAMGREEKVCKQVDDECRNCREPYEDSLVRTCHEITRKVKQLFGISEQLDSMQ